ncbi:MAG TPA: tyramine oxidase subunit B [Synergistales bacterium]|nr:tyramine oxidase subunit B [Synergistales bacterium]
MSSNELKTLLLSQDDLVKAGVLDMPGCVDTIEEVFTLLGKGDYLMGGPKENEHGQMIYFPKEERFPGMPVTGPDRRFMAMIAYLGGRFKICGEKWYGSNSENTKRGLPRSLLTIVLNKSDTGAPFSIMSGNLISAMRTGAVIGVASRHLAKQGARTVGVIGGGVINRACLWAICRCCKSIDEALLFDLNRSKFPEFEREMKEKTGVKVLKVDSVKEAVSRADIVTIATSGEVFPRIETEWLREGVLVNFTGAADLDLDAFQKSTVIADNWKMHEAFICDGKEHPRGIDAVGVVAPSFPLLKLVDQGRFDSSGIRDLGKIILGEVIGRKNNSEKILFLTGGMPVFDLAWAHDLYQNAKRKGLGTDYLFFEESYWK